MDSSSSLEKTYGRCCIICDNFRRKQCCGLMPYALTRMTSRKEIIKFSKWKLSIRMLRRYLSGSAVAELALDKGRLPSRTWLERRKDTTIVNRVLMRANTTDKSTYAAVLPQMNGPCLDDCAIETTRIVYGLSKTLYLRSDSDYVKDLADFLGTKFVLICTWFRHTELRRSHVLNAGKRSYTFAVRLQRQRFEKSPQSRKLVDLVYQYGLSECKDPRDKVYGLLGLAVDGCYILPGYS
jgi:hypothetical protein